MKKLQETVHLGMKRGRLHFQRMLFESFGAKKTRPVIESEENLDNVESYG